MGAFSAVGAWPGVIAELIAGQDLSAEVAAASLERMLDGSATDAQIAAFIVALRIKGETVEEVTGLVGSMLAVSSPLQLDDPQQTLDIVGTGGSAALAGKAFNVSTMASIVAAAAGATVCKHGNRKASSTSGSTDLLESLGIEVELNGEGVLSCMRSAGVGFAFARIFHPSMRHVAPVRAQLGVPTVFNVLGPLSHPGNVGRQVLGVSDPRLMALVPQVLQRRGLTRAWVLHGEGGLDELTTTGATQVTELFEGELRSFVINPEDVGMSRVSVEKIRVGGPEENAAAARSILAAEKGPLRDMVVLNAAAGLVVASCAQNLAEGVELAAASIDDGRAAEVLEKLVAASQAASPLPSN
ncbi:MAG: anthranilate phosphoribosyltransferase [Microthrixaceae bacterium]